ncbi:fungal-specific transcription factor domain-containing protein [Lipomyces tetrasporus]|uniref:Fungal-specific transcription factor domain-containing protein n=1 Tax=Lipomyces tetrasporus TaxID=54092 RepID=A0AAD7VPT5_9ASCO|nr:fungal-specific transcription factor domain-containing protein [Lipomyces tetrasporus]KAJ8098167.1 fungal-specific transcription factor domain-containing protein [Lipomyces tetrasporus]
MASMASIKMNKTCDQCRHRKIRCIVPDTPPGSPPTCNYCAKRGQPCQFSIFRRKARVRVPQSLPASSQPSGKVALGELFIDRVLQYGPQNVVLSDESTVFTAPDEQGEEHLQWTCRVLSSGLAFFSEQKVASLTGKIGNSRLRDVVKRLDDFILSRLGITDGSSWPPIHFQKPSKNEWIAPEEATSYIQAFFTNIYPVYPFLDREEFETQVFSPTLMESLVHNPVFSALYHSVLALGSQFCQGGTFEPGQGRAWELFQVALSHMADLILPRESVESVQLVIQALAAMSIYAMNSCGLQFDDYLISHAARMAVALRYHKDMNSEPKHLRVFWVIYALEKQIAMHTRTCSIIPDEDIGCVIPPFPEAQYQDFNWFVAFIRIGRITSIVSTSLFSISASLRSPELYQSTMDHIHDILEEWQQSIPVEFRPGESTHFPLSASPSVRLAALQIHFSYYHIIIALERLSLYLNRDDVNKGQMSKQRLMNTARTIIELTKHIEVQPHVPIFILVVLPVSAVFILFDLVIHNPYHRESRTNLSLLDSAAGYFSLVDIACNQALPAGMLPEFAHIAREYFWRAQQSKTSITSPKPPDGVTMTDSDLVARLADMEAQDPCVPQDPEFPLVREKDGFLCRLWLTMITTKGTAPTTTDSGVRDAGADPQTVTPTGSDYLDYPTVDLRTMFGWVFPDWHTGGEMDMDPANLEPPRDF